MALTKRKIQSMATKERIRNVAVTLMRTHSIEEISVNEICQKAEVGVGTFYHYYKTKDDIILEVYEDMDALFLQLEQREGIDELGPYEYVLEHCACYARFNVQTGVDFAKKVYAMQNQFSVDVKRPLYTTLGSFLERKRIEGAVSSELDIDEFSYYVNLSLRGVSYDWCINGGGYDLIEKTMWYMQKVLEPYRGFFS